MKEFVIPIQLTKTIPDEPPMEVPTIPNLPSFGTMAPDVIAHRDFFSNKVANDKQSAIQERAKIEEEGNGDQLMEMQELNMPMVDESFIGYEIYMLFEYDGG